MSRERLSGQTPYLVIVAVVAVVAVVTLVMNGTGGTSQGAAVAGDFVDGCFESNPTYDFETKGYVQVGYDKNWDYCIGDVLHQYSCEHNVARPLRPIDCEFGCENGVCLMQQTYG